jgi:SAM-dependent methyltransferase
MGSMHRESRAALKGYGEMAGDYDDVVARVCHYFDDVRAFVDRAVSRGARVLDLGCGTGLNTRHLPPDVEVVGLDLSAAMLREARRSRPATRTRVHDLNRPLPAGLGRFDVVLGVACLEFCRDLPMLCRRIARALNPGGVALLTVPHRERGDAQASALSKVFPDLTWHLFTQRQARAAIVAAGLQPRGGTLIQGWTVRPGRRVVRYALWRAVRAA